MIALSIHSGEGDSLLVLDLLLRRYRRNPRIVMHQALALDPLIDMLGNRLPNRFVDPRGGDIEVEIAAMSRDLGPHDAVLIFPEGGNFTPERRLASIQRLLRRGHRAQARAGARRCSTSRRRARAARSPRWRARRTPTSSSWPTTASRTAAARRGASCPTRRRSWSQMWHVPAAEIPAGTEARIDWLFELVADARRLGRRSAAQASSTATRAVSGRAAVGLEGHGQARAATTEPKISNVGSSPSGVTSTPATIAGTEIAR